MKFANCFKLVGISIAKNPQARIIKIKGTGIPGYRSMSRAVVSGALGSGIPCERGGCAPSRRQRPATHTLAPKAQDAARPSLPPPHTTKAADTHSLSVVVKTKESAPISLCPMTRTEWLGATQSQQNPSRLRDGSRRMGTLAWSIDPLPWQNPLFPAPEPVTRQERHPHRISRIIDLWLCGH